jgi:ubiquinone/menaquinone biosynthesis C-methylase UbiE
MPTPMKIAGETLPEHEHAFKRWMHHHPDTVLQAAGVTEGVTVLDYGCNRGVFTLPAAERVGSRGKIYAADVNAQALRQLRRKAAPSSLDTIETVLIEDTTHPLDWLAEPVDVALLYDVLQVIEDKPALLRSLHRVLKAGGCLSVFPMHVGVDRILALTEDTALFTLQSRYGMLLNFRAAAPPSS